MLGTILLVLLFFSTVTTVASSSRQIWSFARDHGFPFSTWIRQVVPGWDIPVNSLLVALGVSLILGAINFGSNVALNAILSVSNAALLLSYIVSIGALRIRRLRGEPLLPRRWSLGKWGGPINDITLAFLVVTFFFSFWPSYILTGKKLVEFASKRRLTNNSRRSHRSCRLQLGHCGSCHRRCSGICVLLCWWQA